MTWASFIHVFVSGLATGCIYALMALSLVIIYNATRTLNFAQGEMLMLSTFVGWSAQRALGLPLALSVVVAVLAAGVMGWVIERTLIRRAEAATHWDVLIITLGLSLMLRAAAGLVWTHDDFPFPSFFPNAPLVLGPVRLAPVSLGIIAASLALMAALAALFRWTRLGRAMRAVAQNQRAARLMGISVERVYATSWVLAALVGAVAGVLVAWPWIAPRYFVFLASLILVNVVVALGLNLLSGYTNQLSFGHAGFLAIGAYTAALVTIHAPPVPVVLTLVIAGVVTAAVGLAFGVPCLRLGGLYLTMATLAFGFVITEAILSLDALTHGADGLRVPAARLGALGLGGDTARYYLTAAVAAVMVAAAVNLVRTRTGRAFLAIRESEIAAQASGVPVALYKTIAFGLSAFYTGVAGGLFAFVVGFLSPDAFDVFLSVDFVVMIIVGGLGSVPGSIVGAAGVTLLHDGLAAFQNYRPLIFGAILIACVRFMPGGIAAATRRLSMRLVVVLALGVLLLGGAMPATAQQGVTDTEIVIGCSNSFSGPLAYTGEQATRFGVDLYVKVLNDAGGIHGRKIRTVYYDDGYKPQEAVANTRKLAEQDKIFAVIAPQGTPPVMATLEYLEENKIPLLFPFQGSPVIRGKKYVFSGMTLYDRQSKMMIDYLAGARRLKTFGVLYQDDDYGKAFLTAYEKDLGRHNLKLVAAEPVKRGVTDVSAQIAKLRAAGPQVTFLVLTPGPGAQALKERQKIGWTETLMVSSGPLTDEKYLGLAGDAAEGVEGLSLWPDPLTSDLPGLKAYRAAMQKYFDKNEPNRYSLSGYFAAMLFAEGAKRAGRTLTRETLIGALENVKGFDSGILPPITIGPDHETQKQGFWVRVEKGRFKPLTDWLKSD